MSPKGGGLILGQDAELRIVLALQLGLELRLGSDQGSSD